jgi:filamentous hemagglutinin family protein
MDGTVGTSGFYGAPQIPSVVGENPTHVTVSQSMGTTVGANLFHSFSEFNIARGQTVLFSEDSKGFIDNVIARVTGHDISQINGTLRVTPGGHANFYLLNPNGVIFGNGAQIDVPGDFHVTTASFLKFKDGAQYGADPVTSRLSSTDPAAFGFAHGASHNNVMIAVSDGALLASKDKAIDLVGANITIEKGTKDLPNIVSPDIRLVAAKSGHEVSVTKEEGNYLPLPHQTPTRATAGEINLLNGGVALSASDSGGRIGVWGSSVHLMNGSGFEAYNIGSGNPGVYNGINIVSRSLSLVDEGSLRSAIYSGAIAGGNGSDINIATVGRILMKNNLMSAESSNITTGSEEKATGNAGNLSIKAGSLVMEGGGDHDRLALAGSFSKGAGAAGDVWIRVRDDVFLDRFSYIESVAFGAPRSGSVRLNIGGDLTIRNGSLILSEAFKPSDGSVSSGETGDIKVSAASINIIQRGIFGFPYRVGFFSHNENDSGRIGGIELLAKHDINIRGPYADYLDAKYKGIVGVVSESALNTVSTSNGEITLRAGGNISLRGHGSDIPRESPGYNRFANIGSYTGIYSFLAGDSDSSPPSIDISSNGSIIMNQSIISTYGVMKDPEKVPSVSINALGRISLHRSEISDAILINESSRLIPGVGVSLSGGSIFVNDRSTIFSNIPGQGISLDAYRDIFISSKTVNSNYGSKEDALYSPDIVLNYNGTLGSGKISINAGQNLTFFNVSAGAINAFKGSMEGQGAVKDSASLRLDASAESILLSRTDFALAVKGNARDLSSTDVTFSSHGLLPLFNVLKGRFYTMEGGLDPNIIPKVPHGFDNKITIQKNGKNDENVSLSGTLFGISGMLAELRKPAFGSRIDYGACQTLSNGQLSLSGKGGLRGDMGYLLH